MFTINVLASVLSVWFCLNKVGFSLPENEKVKILDKIGDQNVHLKTSFSSDLTKETVGTRRRVKFTKRITKRLGIFDQLLARYERREGLV